MRLAHGPVSNRLMSNRSMSYRLVAANRPWIFGLLREFLNVSDAVMVGMRRLPDVLRPRSNPSRCLAAVSRHDPSRYQSRSGCCFRRLRFPARSGCASQSPRFFASVVVLCTGFGVILAVRPLFVLVLFVASSFIPVLDCRFAGCFFAPPRHASGEMATKPSADKSRPVRDRTPAPDLKTFVIRGRRLSTASSLYPVPRDVGAGNADQPPTTWDRGLDLSMAANERGARGVSLPAQFPRRPAQRVITT